MARFENHICMGKGRPAGRPPVPLICLWSGEAHIDRDVAPFSIGRRTGRLQFWCGPAGRATMPGGPEGGPVACRIGKDRKGRGWGGVFQVPTALRIGSCCMAHLAPDPHPENAPARGPGDWGRCAGRGESCVLGKICRNISSLLPRVAPSVLASQRLRRSGAPWVPSIGGERPAHEGHAARALGGRIGPTGDGDSTATGIGAGRVVEFDPAASSRTVGAMGTGSHAEGRPVVSHPACRVHGLDRQVVDRAAQSPIVNHGRRPDQVLVQTGGVSGTGVRNL